MYILGLKDVENKKIEEVGDRITLFVQLLNVAISVQFVKKKHRRFKIIYTEDPSFKIV